MECKAKHLRWGSKESLNNRTSILEDLDVLAKAVVQVYKTISDYRDGHYPNFPFLQGRHVFPVIVTLESWYLVGPVILKYLDDLIVKNMNLRNLPQSWLNSMPYLILSTYDLERCAIYFNEIDLSELIFSRSQSPNIARWNFADFCNDQYGKNRTALSPIFADEYAAFFEEFDVVNQA